MHSHDNRPVNRSGNRPFEDVLKAGLSRRNVLKRSAVLSATGFLGAMAGESLLSKTASALTQTTGTLLAQATGPAINFTPISLADAAASDGTQPLISPDYQFQVLIPWGTPLQPGGPEYTGAPNSRPTAAEQIQQIGLGHDGIAFFPRNGTSNTEGVICVNHEFARNDHLLDKDAPESAEDVLLSQSAIGVSCIAVQNISGTWQPVASPNNRAIRANTPMTFSGPVAGSPLIQNPAGNAPQGTINNCANGTTPWGTYLTCEENFNGYFGDSTADQETGEGGSVTFNEVQERYGFSATGFGFGWHVFDPRFDLSNPSYVNEQNRFGWIVEIDPEDPTAPPVKRTAMGRIKHENVALTLGRGGRAVCYMGDDQRFDYCYRFVSRANFRSMLARGISPLDQGTLYVARFDDDGTGEWLPLSMDNPILASAFSSQAELLVSTRLAADMVGATPMDRPEWATVGADDKIYWCMTNNSERTEPNGPNPQAPNADGHILEIEDSSGNTGLTFSWNIYILASDTQGEGDERNFADPDGLFIDPEGRLFIETDGGQRADGLQDQLLVADSNDPSNIRRLFMGVSGDEITGLTMTPDRRTMFINMQHVGNGDPERSNFPAATDGVTIPRDCTIVVTRRDGGIIGS